jgi:hypothetical protein
MKTCNQCEKSYKEHEINYGNYTPPPENEEDNICQDCYNAEHDAIYEEYKPKNFSISLSRKELDKTISPERSIRVLVEIDKSWVHFNNTGEFLPHSELVQHYYQVRAKRGRAITVGDCVKAIRNCPTDGSHVFLESIEYCQRSGCYDTHWGS